MSTKMIMEFIHNQKMNEHYKITNINEGYPATPSTYKFNDHIIEVEETIKEEKSFIDPWENKTVIADLPIKLDGEKIDTLINHHPIRVAEKGKAVGGYQIRKVHKKEDCSICSLHFFLYYAFRLIIRSTMLKISTKTMAPRSAGKM